MKILAITTASQVCSVAILDNDNVIKELSINDANTHSQKLMPLIDEIFKKTNLSLNDIDLFACNIGPGSFTGIRIGVATIKAFCDATNKPSIGISSLEGLAYNVTTPGYICSLIDARNDNAYCGLYKLENEKYKKICEDFSDSINKILEFVKAKNNSIIFVGNGGIVFKDMIESNLKNNAIFVEDLSLNNETAISIGKAAFTHSTNYTSEINSLTPLYLRPSNAERTQENKNE